MSTERTNQEEPAQLGPRPMGRVVYRGHTFRKKTGGLRDIGPAAAPPPPGPMPIWFSALMATNCQATADGADHVVQWNCVSGRAFYTNHGPATERIEPLGISLQGGHTLAVSWTPGETAYTLEVLRQFDCCA